MIPSSAFIGLIIPLLIFGALAALTIPVIWRTVTPPRKGVKAPSCEKCRYPVAGHNSFSCPECGADLRVTGIITRPMEMRRRGHLLGALLAWTFLVLLVSYVGFSVFWITVGWRGVATTSGVTTTAITKLTTKSAAYQGIELSQNTGTASPIDLTLMLNDGSRHKLTLDYAAGTAVMTDPNGLETALAVDDRMIAAWFTAAGLPADDPTLAPEVEDVQKIAEYVGAGGWNAAGLRLNRIAVGAPYFSAGTAAAATTPTTPIQTPSPWEAWVPIAILAFSFVVWSLGMVFIVVRRRQLFREATAAEAAATASAPGA